MIPTYRAKGIVGSLEPLGLAKAPYSAGLSEGIWPPVGGMHGRRCRLPALSF